MPRTVAIDGPAGAGKSTIGALVAERLGYTFLDTGAMYRAVALAGLRRGIDPDDGPRLTDLARKLRIAIGPPTVRDGRPYTVLLDGADVTWPIRSPEVDRIVSQVARVPYVRDVMVEQQRAIADRAPTHTVMTALAGTPTLPQERLWLWRLGFPIVRALAGFLCPWRLEGAENVPPSGPFILVSNHINWKDPPWMEFALGRAIRYMAKRELFQVPVIGYILRAIGAFPVRRGEADRGALQM